MTRVAKLERLQGISTSQIARKTVAINRPGVVDSVENNIDSIEGSSEVMERTLDVENLEAPEERTTQLLQAEAVDESIMHEISRLCRIERQPIVQDQVVAVQSKKTRLIVIAGAAGFLMAEQ